MNSGEESGSRDGYHGSRLELYQTPVPVGDKMSYRDALECMQAPESLAQPLYALTAIVYQLTSESFRALLLHP